MAQYNASFTILACSSMRNHLLSVNFSLTLHPVYHHRHTAPVELALERRALRFTRPLSYPSQSEALAFDQLSVSCRTPCPNHHPHACRP